MMDKVLKLYDDHIDFLDSQIACLREALKQADPQNPTTEASNAALVDDLYDHQQHAYKLKLQLKAKLYGGK